jgi:hypothetical protein
MDDLVKRVRSIGIGSELGATTRDRTTAQKAADRIEALEAALREIAAPSKIMAKGGDMEKALVTLLSSHHKIANAALEGEKKDV